MHDVPRGLPQAKLNFIFVIYFYEKYMHSKYISID